jgi:hypothetical protein
LLGCGAAGGADNSSSGTTTGPQPTDAAQPTGTDMAMASATATPAAAPATLPIPGGATDGFVDSDANLAAAAAPPPPASDAVTDCASADAPAALSKVVLAFVFDVSASMGSESRPYDSKTLKWDPVVAATKAFFADPNSKGISATLTFFPNEFADLTDTLGGQAGGGMAPTDPTTMDPNVQMQFMPGGGGFGLAPQGTCDSTEYATPDVALTDLPSDVFSAAIDAVTPADSASWRLSTPTLPALQGTIDYIDTMRAADPSASYSIVLVTDGMPALCQQVDDSVQDVADAVATVADTTPTYVIGVNNPVTTEEPNPPDSVSDLNLVAQAGGTGDAFLINTDDPTQTSTELANIIEQIRNTSFTCSLAIPPPPNGKTFDKELVNVQFTTASGDLPYDYDPDCTGANGWHFDDEANPTSIELCDAACTALTDSLDTDGGQLAVQFGCERRMDTGAR